MKNKKYKVCLLIFSASLLLTNSVIRVHAQEKTEGISLQDLSAFTSPGKSWSIVQDVNASVDIPNKLTTINGSGNILVNLPSKKVKGTDLFTKTEYGDVELELKFLMSKSGNSGIYLQGRYEVQLEDSWNLSTITSASNGGIYNLISPRVNATKAPGLWQDLKISFQAPRFNSAGEKTENARILKVELNGVVVQDNVELFKPTPGSVSNKEVSKATLRIQGDHGAIAFKDLVIRDLKEKVENDNERFAADPILVDASENTILRSFIDLDNKIRVVHAVSVGTPKNLHYTYDMDYGMLVQVWRGGFLDATPMWDGRGNGTSVPLGAVQRFGKPLLGVAKLVSAQATWPSDTVGTQYKPKGYTVDADENPTFTYQIYGSKVTDAIRVSNDGRGLVREINVDDSNVLYFRLASAKNIVETSKGTFIVGDKEYYLRVDNPKKDKTILREVDGGMELIVPINGQFNYSIIL